MKKGQKNYNEHQSVEEAVKAVNWKRVLTLYRKPRVYGKRRDLRNAPRHDDA